MESVATQEESDIPKEPTSGLVGVERECFDTLKNNLHRSTARFNLAYMKYAYNFRESTTAHRMAEALVGKGALILRRDENDEEEYYVINHEYRQQLASDQSTAND